MGKKSETLWGESHQKMGLALIRRTIPGEPRRILTAHAGGHLKRVLVVPDQIVADEIGATFFDRLSVGVRGAATAAEALGIATAWRPDLIALRSDLVGSRARDFCLLVRGKLPRTLMLVVDEMVGHEDNDGLDGLYDARLVQPVSAEQLLSTAAELLAIPTRRAPRVGVETLVHLTGFGLATKGQGTLANAINVSELGMLLEAGAQLELKAQGTLAFFLPGSSERLVVGGVVRVALDEVLLHYAIEFEDTAARTVDELRRYVSHPEPD